VAATHAVAHDGLKTDDLKSSFYINGLGLLESPCHL